MRENRTYGSEGGESRRLFSTPISRLNSTRVARQNSGFVRYAGYLNYWIPACAGMTGF